MVGEGISRLMEKIIAKKGLSADKNFLIDRFVAFYSDHLIDATTIYPGVTETLERLNRYKKAVISNKREALSARILEKLDLAKFLDIIVGSDSTPERKPSPVPVQYVLSQVGVKPEEAVIVGDSNYDIEAGKAAGIRTVAVTYGYRTLDFLRGADFIIKGMPELMAILETTE
jgi:phosphoglycolate phosphatase